MPTVPIEQNRVGLAGVTDEKLRPGDYGGSGLQAAGAGMATFGKALDGVAEDQLKREQQRRRDNAAAEDAALKQSYNAYDARARALLRDGDASFYAQTGQVAVEAAEGISATLRQIPREIGTTLQPPIRALFDAVVGQRVDQDIAGVQDHADAEKRVWQGEQAEQLMAASARNALDHIGAPLFVDHVATGLKALDNRSAVQGWNAAVKRAAEHTYVSDIHKRAIDGLTVGDAIAADHYFALHASEMTARDRAEVEDSLRAPVLERRGAAVVDAYGASLSQAETGLAAPYAPRRADLPALREHIEQQDLPDDVKATALADADARAARVERGIEQGQRAARDAAFALTDDLGEGFTSLTQLPPAMRRALDSETLDALTRRAGATLRPEPVEAMGETAHRLVALSATDRQAFVNTDLRPYRDLVTPDEYAALIAAQRGWQASPPALSAVMGQRTWEAIGHRGLEFGVGENAAGADLPPEYALLDRYDPNTASQPQNAVFTIGSGNRNGPQLIDIGQDRLESGQDRAIALRMARERGGDAEDANTIYRQMRGLPEPFPTLPFPPPPPKAATDGTNEFNVRFPTAKELAFHTLMKNTLFVPRLVGYRRAAVALEHYLDGGGGPMTLDVDRMLQEIPNFRKQSAEQFDKDVVGEIKHRILSDYRGSGLSFKIITPWGNSRAVGDKEDTLDWDWFHTVGGFDMAHTAVVTVSPDSGDVVKVNVKYNTRVFDRYNWDSKKKTFPMGIEIDDRTMGALSSAGLAREFDMMGTSSPRETNLRFRLPKGRIRR
jgi:hypothetical protein